MACIEERKGKKGSSWRVQVRVKGHPVQTETFARKTDAVRWAQQIEADFRAGRHVPTSQARRRTLAELIAAYRQRVLPQYGAGERKRRASKLGWWDHRLGAWFLSDLTPARIAECRDELAEGKSLSGLPASPASQVRYLAQLSHVLSYGIELEWIADNPARRVRRPREPRGRVRFLSETERERLLAACREDADPRLYPLVLLALSTGARQGELLRLRWPDLDLQRRLAIVHHTKNGDRKALPLVDVALTAIRQLATLWRLGTDLVFADRRGVARFPRHAWDVTLRRAGVSEFRFHDLRHTTASYLAMSGATLAEIAEVLGHRTLAMVKRYAHLSEQHTSSVVRRMEERFLR
jgi:integrase